MSESVFIETTIPSYYVAKRPRDIVQAARQELTIEWWDRHRSRYELLSSQIVLDEAARGDGTMAKKRLDLLSEIPLLVITDAVVRIAEELLKDGVVPENAGDDAFHIACAGVHVVNFLLTWNCKHIANAQIQGKLAEISLDCGYVLPVLCTPNELMGD